MHVCTHSSQQLKDLCEMELVFAAAIVRWAVALLPLRWRLKWRPHRGLTRCESSCPAIISTATAWPLMNPSAAAHLMLISQLVMLQVLSGGNMMWWCVILCKNASWSSSHDVFTFSDTNKSLQYILSMLPEYLENNRTRVFLKHHVIKNTAQEQNSYQHLLFQASYQLFHYVISDNGTWNKHHLALFLIWNLWRIICFLFGTSEVKTDKTT